MGNQEIFACQRCGHCCHGATTVSLDEADQKRMCAHLGMERDEVARRYWRITGTVVQMKVENGHCIFYDDGCTVHPGRPWRCRQWPLHPSLLLDGANLSAIRDSCPGINQDMRYEEFCVRLRALLARQQEQQQ